MRALALVVVLAGCSSAPAQPTAVPPPAVTQLTIREPPVSVPAPLDGRAIIESYQCTSCHEIEAMDGRALARPTGGRDCYGCHRAVAEGTFAERPAMHEQWKRELPSKFDAPTLRGVGRFQRRWLVAYLQRPHDVRHNLAARMPRMPITVEQAEAIADFFGATDREDAPVTGDAGNGAVLFEQLVCVNCHTAQPSSMVRPVILAPDLGHAIDRLGRAGVIRWIVDPPAMKPDAMMPRLGIDEARAADLTAYIETLEPTPMPPRTDRVPYRLTRLVPFSEVYRGVLRENCLHCHNRPESSGMGGPGYTGGWGYEGKGQSLFTYEHVMAGGHDAAGNPRSLFDPIGPDNLPRIVAHLVARHHEVAGDSTEIVGMPLGQPPVPWEKIDAVYTWILQGRLP